jgi:tRNA pseudouridine32 synthase/23S rRNA pseudouridine746 synthase
MLLPEHYFTPFKTAIDAYTLPERFTFPFYYQPHPLCVLAAKELQHHLNTQQEWQHNFGLSKDKDTITGKIGKMFGVLLVKNNANEIGYLSAFSGKLAGTNHLSKFVPPVFDMLTEDGFFQEKEGVFNRLNKQITVLENNPHIVAAEITLKTEQEAANVQIKAHRTLMIAGRKQRKAQRIAAESALNAEDFLPLNQQLGKESIAHKKQLKALTHYWRKRVQQAEENVTQLTAELGDLKHQRKSLSAALQQQIFEQYHFLNEKGVAKSLFALFEQTTQRTPPAAAGECAAPKLLHYAFKVGLKPLAMAEFWWGESPKSAVRKHLNFYPACQGKCQPILAHMLEGMALDENPLLSNPAEGKSLEVVYEDEVMLVINKPAEFLSVPGKNVEDSVYSRIKQRYPHATGPLIVHRLDMSTSGLLLIALCKEAHKNLQKQFIQRTIKKRYVALLEGVLTDDQGMVDLPLRVDLDDRPRQLICYDYGKPAQTQWEVIERIDQQTKVYFYPITGRTHQLRVHAAHLRGLNTPIVGDDLYGQQANRLHLHAESLTFNHPLTGALMRFQVEAAF